MVTKLYINKTLFGSMTYKVKLSEIEIKTL